MRATPHLHFKGDCREAFETYHRILDGTLEEMMPWSRIPDNGLPDDWQDKITHASLVNGDLQLTGGDTPPRLYKEPGGLAVLLQVEGIEKSEAIFHGLADGGTVTMPLQEVFWTARFGMLTDRFGIPWMINGSAE